MEKVITGLKKIPTNKKIKDEICLKLYEEGKTDIFIGKYFNCDASAVVRWREKRNLKCKSNRIKVFVPLNSWNKILKDKKHKRKNDEKTIDYEKNYRKEYWIKNKKDRLEYQRKYRKLKKLK